MKARLNEPLRNDRLLNLPEPALTLVRRLFSRLTGRLSPGGQADVQNALRFAATVHKGETRLAPPDGGSETNPFIVHPVRLALVLAEEAAITCPRTLSAALSAALCHDTLEHDRRLTRAELVCGVGPECARAVEALSVPHKLNPGESRSASRVNYLNQLRGAGEAVLLAKAADRLDNLRHRTQAGPPERLAQMIAQDREDYLPLFERHLAPPGRPLIERIRFFIR